MHHKKCDDVQSNTHDCDYATKKKRGNRDVSRRDEEVKHGSACAFYLFNGDTCADCVADEDVYGDNDGDKMIRTYEVAQDDEHDYFPANYILHYANYGLTKLCAHLHLKMEWGREWMVTE